MSLNGSDATGDNEAFSELPANSIVLRSLAVGDKVGIGAWGTLPGSTIGGNVAW